MLYKESFKQNDFNKFAKLEQLNSMLKSRDKGQENSRLTLQIDNSKANKTEGVSMSNHISYFPNISNKIVNQKSDSEGNQNEILSFLDQLQKLAFITVNTDMLGAGNASTSEDQLKKLHINKSSEIYKDVIRWKKNINIYFK